MFEAECTLNRPRLQSRIGDIFALLLENEALEEALASQNDKLRQERTDALREQLRNNSYRRVLISQLLNDQRIKSYVAEIISDDKRLPEPPGHAERASLPERTGDERPVHE